MGSRVKGYDHYMKKDRTFYAKRNMLFGMINKIIAVFFPFVIRTIVIKRLGAEYLGLSSLFTAILQAFSVAEMGFSSAIVFKMYKPIAENDIEKICALLSLYRKVYKAIGIGIMIIGLCIMPFIKLIIKGTYPSDINIYTLFLVYLASTVISYLGVAYKTSLLSVAQRQDIVSNIDSLLVVCRSVLQIVMLIVFRNYYLYIIWNPVSVLLNNVIISFVSKKMYPAYECRGNIEKSELNEITTQIKGLAIGKIGFVSRNSFDSIALSMYSGLVEVTIYSNYYYIFTAVSGFLGVIITAITAGVGNSLVTESREKNYYDFIKFNYYYAWISGWCTVCLYCLYQQFMVMWVGEELTAPAYTMVLFCVYFYISQMGQIRAVYASASGIWWEFRKFQIAEAIANPILNFVLGYFWGMNGILIATIVTVFAFSVFGIGSKTMRFCFGKSPFEYFGLSTAYVFVIVIASKITGEVCGMINGMPLVNLILSMLICIVLPNAIFAVFSFSFKSHKKMLIEARGILKRH